MIVVIRVVEIVVVVAVTCLVVITSSMNIFIDILATVATISISSRTVLVSAVVSNINSISSNNY